MISQTFLATVWNWSMHIRLIAFAIFTAAILVFWTFSDLEFNPIPVLILSTIALLTHFLWHTLRNQIHINLYYALLGLDTALIASIVYATGGQQSPFPFLFLIPISLAALLSSTSAIFFGLLGFLMYLAIIFLTLPNGLDYPTIIRILRLTILGTIIIVQNAYLMTKLKTHEKELAQVKDAFLFRTIHDLKSPLTILQWTTQTLSAEKSFQKNPALKNELESLKHVARSMTSLMNDVLTIARGENQKTEVDKQHISLPRVCAEILQNYSGVLQNKSITIHHDLPKTLPEVFVDRKEIHEVLINLIDNAIKYSPQNGTISIWYKKKDGSIAASIKDSGPGISASDKTKLFAPYFRGTNVQSIEGTGLGLYLANMLVKKMGGTLSVTSRLDHGSTFTVTLPVSKKAH